MDKFSSFVVVGSDFVSCPDDILFSVSVGDRVFLEAEPDNRVDEHAVLVIWNDWKLGYIPNKGLTCPNCGHRCRPKMKRCSVCTNSELVKKGLAYRLILNEVLQQNYVCYVKEKMEDNLIKCEIWVGDTEDEYGY